jgi:hypothetical protein
MTAINYRKIELIIPYNPNIHYRRSIRLKGCDYSQTGMYFVTICVQNRECLIDDNVEVYSCGRSTVPPVPAVLLICADTDFQIAMEIVKVLLQHAAFVFRQCSNFFSNLFQILLDRKVKIRFFYLIFFTLNVRYAVARLHTTSRPASWSGGISVGNFCHERQPA